MVDLIGKRVLITRPREQIAEFAAQLLELGALPLAFPVISIGTIKNTHKLDQALENLGNYQWLVFTSVNGVDAVWKRMAELGLENLPSKVKIAAIGPKTSAALDERGVQVNFMPSEYIAEAILPGLGDIQGQRILLLRADIARADLAIAIQKVGCIADEVAVYHTIQADPHDSEWAELENGVDLITFTSTSTVKNFLSVLESKNYDIKKVIKDTLIACIGPIAARTARESGLKVDIVASEYTIEGLVSAMKSFEDK